MNYGYTEADINNFCERLVVNYNKLNEAILTVWKGRLIPAIRPVWKGADEQGFETAIAKKLVEISKTTADITNDVQQNTINLFKSWVDFINSIKVQGQSGKKLSSTGVRLKKVSPFSYSQAAPAAVTYSQDEMIGLTADTEPTVIAKIDDFISELSGLINGFKSGLSNGQPFAGKQKIDFDNYVASCQNAMIKIIAVINEFKDEFKSIKVAYEQADITVSKSLTNAADEINRWTV